ncbi:MAG: lysoplasmalogenase [Actinomycetota bacterium]
MNDVAGVLLGVTAVIAVVDWVAVATHRRLLEYVAKPLTTVGLLAVAMTVDPVHADVRAAFAVALVLSLAGDVFLMLPGDRWFVPGLASFLLAHLAYVAGFALGPGSGAELLIGVLVVLVVSVPMGVRLIRAVRRTRPELTVPVAAYVLVIAAMVASATGWGNAWAVAGAWLFFVSDALIGETRFVRPEVPRWGPLAVIVTYHLAQAGLVVSLVHR